MIAPFVLAHLSDVSSCEARFPMDVTEELGGGAGLALELRPADLPDLDRHERVLFLGIPLPDGTAVDVEARRIVLDDSELVVMVDGEPSESVEEPSSMWAGRVVGDGDSDAFLAFSRAGSRGWIRRAGETFHLLAGPGRGGDWTNSVSRLVAEEELLARGARPVGCVGDALQPPNQPSRPAPSSLLGGGSGGMLPLGAVPTLSCRMAVETDYQLFAAFGNLTAEQTYATQLFAAGSARYDEQISVVLTRVYAAYYTANNDPWVAPDAGGSTSDLLYELQALYAGNPPNNADLTTAWSGAGLGGGVAWLDVLCNTSFGFSVSANLTLQGGLTPFPVVQGPLNWDFFVTTHEFGHNFGTPHTHDFCPPIDECAPQGWFGSCQTQQVCITNGTIMSYCHQCPNGMSDIYPYFAQACADLMRQRAENSCLGPACSFPTTFCPATPNSTGLQGVISWSGSQSISANTFTLDADQLPLNKTAFFFYGTAQTQVSVGQGWRCAGGNVFRLRPAQNTGITGSISRLLDFSQPPAGSGSGAIPPGSTRYFQAIYRDPAAGGSTFLYNYTTALAVEFCP